MGRKFFRTFGAAYLFSSLAFVAAVVATHFLGQAVLESMVALIGVVILLGVS
jgi:hypothetical protein